MGVTEQYVFMKPFAVNDPTNKHDPLLNDEVARLRSDKKCLDRAEEMRKLFVECHDSFCHGDLHTGSVMVKDGQCKVIGYVVQNMIFSNCLFVHFFIDKFLSLLSL